MPGEVALRMCLFHLTLREVPDDLNDSVVSGPEGNEMENMMEQSLWCWAVVRGTAGSEEQEELGCTSDRGSSPVI